MDNHQANRRKEARITMKQQAIPLGRILGIPIGLDYSWFLVFVLLTWTLAVGYYPAEFKHWPVVQYWVIAALTALLLFGSVLLHELGHSGVAMRYQIPVRSITLFIFGGVAQIGAEPPSASAEFWIAIAGPAVSFALALLFGLLRPVFAPIVPLLALISYLAYINGALALFNLIPGFPLDGGRVFRAIVWGFSHNLRRATVIAGNLGRLIGFLFILFGVWQLFGGDFVNGMWIAFIGWFLESAAVAQIQQQRLQELLTGHKVSEVMRPDYTAIPDDTPLQDMVDHHILGRGQRRLIVEREDEVAGLLTLHRVKEIPRGEWATTTVAQAMIPLAQLKRTRPEAELWAAMEAMDRDGVNQLPVMTNGHILGMLSRDDVITYLRTLEELAV
jgi:Zn-dependent protease/CBS domain-containing protein